MKEFSMYNWRLVILRHAELSPNAKYLALYLSTFMNEWGDSCYPSIARIVSETGLSKPTVIKYLEELKETQWLICGKKGVNGKGWAHNQYYPNIPDKAVNEFNLESEGGKNETTRRLNSEHMVVNEVSHYISKELSNNYPRGRFTPPTLQEVTDYCKTRNNNVDPERFVDFYEAKGWMVGKNRMKDWKAAIRTWEKREKEDSESPVAQKPWRETAVGIEEKGREFGLNPDDFPAWVMFKNAVFEKAKEEEAA